MVCLHTCLQSVGMFFPCLVPMIFSFMLFSFRWSDGFIARYKGFLDPRYGFSVTFLTRVPFDPGFFVALSRSLSLFTIYA